MTLLPGSVKTPEKKSTAETTGTVSWYPNIRLPRSLAVVYDMLEEWRVSSGVSFYKKPGRNRLSCRGETVRYQILICDEREGHTEMTTLSQEIGQFILSVLVV